jgi:hypothetical protein
VGTAAWRPPRLQVPRRCRPTGSASSASGQQQRVLQRSPKECHGLHARCRCLLPPPSPPIRSLWCEVPAGTPHRSEAVVVVEGQGGAVGRDTREHLQQRRWGRGSRHKLRGGSPHPVALEGPASSAALVHAPRMRTSSWVSLEAPQAAVSPVRATPLASHMSKLCMSNRQEGRNDSLFGASGGTGAGSKSGTGRTSAMLLRRQAGLAVMKLQGQNCAGQTVVLSPSHVPRQPRKPSSGGGGGGARGGSGGGSGGGGVGGGGAEGHSTGVSQKKRTPRRYLVPPPSWVSTCGQQILGGVATLRQNRYCAQAAQVWPAAGAGVQRSRAPPECR